MVPKYYRTKLPKYQSALFTALFTANDKIIGGGGDRGGKTNF